MKKETTLDDILGALQICSSDVDGRLNNIERKISTMVTKDYLDCKIADLRGDIISLMTSEDKAFTTSLDLLEKKKVFTSQETKHIYSLRPFKSKGTAV